MPIGNDDDLFDAPVRTKKPSNKIVHQPAGVSWSLSRLSEVETAYQATFKKKLPLVNRGQGGIHNKWGYDHRDSADVSINPSTPEGQKFIEQLKAQGIPFLAFTGAIPGVATGPHFHIGFPSRRTTGKFNIGAQRKSKGLASDDLFDSPNAPEKSAPVSDDDLFDNPVSGKKKVDPFSRVAIGPRNAERPPMQRMLGVTGGVQGQVKPQRPSLGRMATALPGAHQILNLLPEEDRENVVEGATGAIGGTLKQLANAQDLGLSYSPYGIAGRKALERVGLNAREIPATLRQGEQAISQAVTENEERRPQPTTFTGQVRRGVGRGVGMASIELPKLILGGKVLGAANLPVQGALGRADEGIPGIIKGAAGGLVYHYGGQVTGKFLGKVGNSLVWIAGPTTEQQVVPRLYGEEAPPLGQSIGENIPIGLFAGVGGAKKVRIKTPKGERDATASDLDAIVQKRVEVVPPERTEDVSYVETQDRSIGSQGQNTQTKISSIATERPPALPGESERHVDGGLSVGAPQRFRHIQFGEVEVVPDQSGARPGKIKVAEVSDPTKQHFVKKSDMQGRGNSRMIPVKEASNEATEPIGRPSQVGPETLPDSAISPSVIPTEPGGVKSPSIPERPETIQAQLEARGYSLIPTDAPRPSLPQGYRAEKTADGVVYYDPKRIDAETIRNTPTTELLGHVEPKSEKTTQAVVARDAEGNEVHASAVSPENVAKQVETTKANFPEAKVEAGGPELAEKVIADRLEPSTTSARKEQFKVDRAELDLPELPTAERKGWQTTLDEAKTKGTENAGVLADEVLVKPRSLNEVETAQLVLRAQEIKNDYSRVMKEIGDAKDTETITAKRAEVEALEREFDKLTQATKASGTEKGRALAAQKLTINQDFDLVSLVQRAKAAKGREITGEERARYEKMAADYSRLEKQLAESNERNAQLALQKDINRVRRKIQRSETKQTLDSEFADLKAQFAQARAEIKSIQPSGLAGLDPEGKLTILIGKMARNRIKAGTVEAGALVDEIHAAIKDYADVSKRDVRDAISGYKMEQPERRSDLERRLAEVRSELQSLSKGEDIGAGIRAPHREGPTKGEVRQVPMEGPRQSDARSSGIPLQGPKLGDVRKVPSEGPRKSEARSSGQPLEGPKLSDVRKVPQQGPRLSEAAKSGKPLQGPKLSDIRRVPQQGPRLSEARQSGVPLQGPKMSEANKLPAEGPVRPVEGVPKQLFTRDVTRRKALLKEEADLQRRLRERDFSEKTKRAKPVYSKETQNIQDRLDRIKSEYQREIDRERPGRFWRTLSGMRKAWMLSGPVTQIRNIVGTGAYQAFDEGARLPAWLADTAISGVTKQRSIQGLSPTAMLDSAIHAATTGVREAKSILKTGVRPEDSVRHQFSEIDTGVKAVDLAHNAIFRFMSASDRVFYQGAYKRNLIDRATIQAKNESRTKTTNVKERIEELKDHPPELLVVKPSVPVRATELRFSLRLPRPLNASS